MPLPITDPVAREQDYVKVEFRRYGRPSGFTTCWETFGSGAVTVTARIITLVSPASNPSGPSVGPHRVSRGGSRCSKPPRANTAFRKHDPPNFRFYRLGFRLARTARETREQAK
jgi:hypothetical protein